MTERAIDIVRRVYEGWEKGDFRAAADLYDEASVFVLSPDFPDSGIYVGSEQMTRYMHDFLEPWENLKIECLDMFDSGDTVVAEVRQSAQGTRSGADTGFTYFQVWTLRGGMLMRLQNVMRREEALSAIGRA
ncbi:MAG TPA: nuclear transport factor 2 family protein [Solirubrobacterales bacterium]|nr:nuclear transport factor 2 family protein [Solirubrobacterales bacterium]